MSGKIDFTFIKGFIKEIDISKANMLSYTALSGVLLSIQKGEKRDVSGLERDELEKLVKASAEAFRASKKRISELQNSIENALIGLGYEVRRVTARLVSRGFFGANEVFGKTVFDVGLSFDPILNVPFIPGSSLKGAIRNAYASLVKNSRDEERLFGSTKAGAGLVEVTDAYPIEAGENGYILYPDVMTPHYPGAKTELEVKPRPIVYLTVAPKTLFRFYVYFKLGRGNRRIGFKQEGVEGDLSEEPEPSIEKLGLVDLSVIYALNLGVGAKTSAGYSILEVEEYKAVRRSSSDVGG